MLALIVALIIAVSDQLTKEWVRESFALGETRPVVEGFFNFTYVRNTGAAWGIMGGQNTWLTILSIVMLILMLVFRRSFLNDTWEHRLSLGLLIGGIVGNLLDRIRLGFVTDFLDFYWRTWHWPSFNIADAAICTGVGIYILSSLWMKDHALQNDVSENVIADGGANKEQP